LNRIRERERERENRRIVKKGGVDYREDMIWKIGLGRSFGGTIGGEMTEGGWILNSVGDSLRMNEKDTAQHQHTTQQPSIYRMRKKQSHAHTQHMSSVTLCVATWISVPVSQTHL